MESYQKRKTLGNCHSGVEYQCGLTVVIMLGAAVLIIDGKDELQFVMTTEDLKGGNFDDIGFRFKTKWTPKKWTQLYIQAKHTLNINNKVTWNMITSSNKQAPLAMNKYYDSFCSIAKSNKNRLTTKDELILVLCTNQSLQQQLKRSMNKNPSENKILNHIFKLLSANHYQFSKKSKLVRGRLRTMFPKNEQLNFSRFLRTFILACKTINQNLLENKIKELLNILTTKSLKLELMGNLPETQYDSWTKLVMKWIYDKQGKTLNENDIILFFIHSYLRLFSDAYELGISNAENEKTKVKWEENELYNNLKRWFREGTSITPDNCQEKPYIVLEIIDKLKKEKELLFKSHLFLKSSDFIKFKDHVLQLFYDIDQPFLLVIDCTDTVECNIESRYGCKKNGHAKVMIKIEEKKDSLFRSEYY